MIQIPNNLKFEENFENLAIKGLRQVNLHGVNARFSEELTDQKIQVMFEVNGNLEEAILQVGNFRKYTAYEGEIAFIVSTNRATIRNHPEKLAKVRYMMLPENEFLEHEYYQILETREMSANTEISEELNSDVTVLTFSIKFILKG
jgi:hypothetical protein